MSESYEMKYSGTEWLGLVPASWRIGKIGSLYSLRNTIVSDRDYPPLSVTMKGIIPQLESAAKTDDHDSRKLVKKGDFAINSRSDRRGSCGISEYDGSVSLINTVLTPRENMIPRYYNWLFHTVQFADEFYKNGHGIVDDLWTTRWDEMKRILIPVPDKEEQATIATYLDRMAEKIDSIVVEAKASIDDYLALRKSVITRVVTSGLNEHGAVKYSGYEWMGDIPDKWKIAPLKHVSKKAITYGVIKLFEPDANGVFILRCSDVKAGFIDTSAIRTITQDLSEEYKRTILSENDVVINVRGTLGGCAVIPKTMEGYNIAREVALISPKREEFNSRFVMYYLLSDVFERFQKSSLSGAIYVGINMETLSRFKIAYPSIDEQKKIADYLDKIVSNIDSLIEEKKSLINDLQIYKKSLIFEVVTGKRKVV